MDKIKLETKKVEIDIERELYYSKLRDAWKNYVIARQSLSDIVGLCNKKKVPVL